MLLQVRIFLILLLSQMALAIPEYRELWDFGELSANKRLTDEDLGDFIRTCNQEPIELGLVIDSSSSIKPADFKKGQQFLTDFLSEYDIGPGRKQVRVAAVTYGFGVYEDDAFNLNTFKTKEEVLQAVQHMPFRAGLRTDTGDAIKYMRERQMVKTRDWAPKVVIVLTDGNSQKRSYTAQQASLAREDNITMFAVGVGQSVSNQELFNIAGDQERVFRSDNYEDLRHIKADLSHKACTLNPKPTTTTTTTTTTATTTTTTEPQKEQECKDLYPSDINFVFSPASLGTDATSWVTQFISHTISSKDLSEGFQYGVISGSCPADAGFPLNQYSSVTDIRGRLSKYDRNNLPELVHQTTSSAFSTANGGRSTTSKIAVIFLGKAKVDRDALYKATQEMLDAGIKVFVSRTEPGIAISLPAGVQLLQDGSSINQSGELVQHICHID